MDAFNGFQNGYQQNNYQQPYPQRNWQQYYQVPQTMTNPVYQQQPQTGNMIWVKGRTAADGYNNLQPGIPVALWDEDEKVVYIKYIDQMGKPQITVLDYTERGVDNSEKDTETPEYVTKQQLDDITAQLSSITKQLESFQDFVTKDQLTQVNNQLSNLDKQVTGIEDRITSFGKPQNNSNSNSNYRKGNK